MKTKQLKQVITGLALIGLAMGSSAIYAAGTLSGTTVNNSATLVSSDGTTTSNQTSFIVDNKVKVTVTETNSTSTQVKNGDTASVVTFTVTNDGNTPQDYQLTGANVANGTTNSVFGTTDTFDATACSAFAETAGGVGYQPGSDTTTFLDEIAPDVTTTVYVVCNIPAGATNGDFAAISLMATTSNAGTASTLGAITTETASANTSGVDVVYADVAGAEAVDTAQDGKHSARDAYLVTTATITIAKNVDIICDPFNYNNNAKFIPGAYIQYTFTLTNTGAAGTLTSLSDPLSAEQGLDPDMRQGAANACESSAPESAIGNSVHVVCSDTVNDCQFTQGTGGTGNFYFTADVGDADTDGVSYTGGAGGTAQLLFTTMGDTSIGAGESMTIRFNAIIQ